MSKKLSRRDFLKLSCAAAAAGMVLVGCGPASRYVTRVPYAEMPEYQHIGKSTYYATTCRECPAGCGLIVRTFEGRAIKVEGNPNHPVNRGKICPRGLTSVQGVYNLDRITGPVMQGRRGKAGGQAISWDEAVALVKKRFQETKGSEIAFLLGAMPDSLYDLTSELASALKAPAPVRYSALNYLEGRDVWLAVASQYFGTPSFPYFDLENAEIVFNFGAEFLENWLSPMAYSRGYRGFRKGQLGARGYMVSFAPRQSISAAAADEWIPIKPGSEALVALALTRLAAYARSEFSPEITRQVDIKAAAEASGISEEKLKELASRFAGSNRPLAIGGGSALAGKSAFETASAILALNATVYNFNQTGGVFLTPAKAPSERFADVQALFEKMRSGAVKTLFIHGVNPLFDLPAALNAAEAFKRVETIVSFSSFPDETALASDYILPDHTMLEGWGYQTVLAGTTRKIVSAIQPVVVPLYDTRSTADVLIAAGGLPYKDEVDFLQQKILPLMSAGGTFTAPELPSFWAKFLQYGGWWQKSADYAAIDADALLKSSISMPEPHPAPADQYHLVVYPTQFGDGSGANRPWLHETPNPATTVMWNSWVEIHPQTAKKLGIHDDDVVRIRSEFGEIEAVAYLYPALRPDTVALPFGLGHEALGRFAEGRGCNPARLFPNASSQNGNLAWADTLVSLSPTGKRRPIARQESRHGVYGDGE